MRDSNKAPILFAVYKILFDYSDEDNPLTQDKIIKYLYDNYKIQCTRNTVKNNIDILENVFEIEFDRIPNEGIYLCDRLITEAEMKFLSDAIYAYSAVNGTYANDMVTNLSKIFSINKRDKFIHKRYSTEKIRKKDQSFLYKLEQIDRAINDKKKIAFFTFTYNELGQRKKTHKGKYKTIVSPYYTVSNMGKHYLIYKDDKYNNLSCTRIEFIDEKIEILDSDIVPINIVDSSFNISEFMNTQNYMFSSNIVDAKIKLFNENAIRDAKDWFGDNAIISYDCDNEEVFAKIKTDEQGLIYWALQYCDELEIVEPLKTRNRMEAFIRRSYRNYSKNIKLDTIDLNSILYDSLSSLRYFNNLEKEKDESITKAIQERVNDFLYSNYSSTVEGNIIKFKHNLKNEIININVNILKDDPDSDKYFEILKSSSFKQKESTQQNKIVDIFITSNKNYFSYNSTILNEYFGVDYKVNKGVVEYNGETIEFISDINSHWNPIIKYADIKLFRFVYIIY